MWKSLPSILKAVSIKSFDPSKRINGRVYMSKSVLGLIGGNMETEALESQTKWKLQNITLECASKLRANFSQMAEELKVKTECDLIEVAVEHDVIVIDSDSDDNCDGFFTVSKESLVNLEPDLVSYCSTTMNSELLQNQGDDSNLLESSVESLVIKQGKNSSDAQTDLETLQQSVNKTLVIDDQHASNASDIDHDLSYDPILETDSLNCFGSREKPNCNSNIPFSEEDVIASAVVNFVREEDLTMDRKGHESKCFTSLRGRQECATSGIRKGVEFEDISDEDLPCFMETNLCSKLEKKSFKTEVKKNESLDNDKKDVDVFEREPKLNIYSIDQLLADHREDVKHRAIAAELRNEKSVQAHSESLDREDILPEHKEELKRVNVVENRIRSVHPGEEIFKPTQFKSLFSYPETLTLAGCGFRPGQSYTDEALTSLAADELLEFLDPGFFKIVFPAISSKENFLKFIFYLLSISPDHRSGRRIHEILDRVLHGQLSTWTPTTFDVCCVLVNYGASLSNLCPDPKQLSFSETVLTYLKPESAVKTKDKQTSKEAANGRQEILKSSKGFDLKSSEGFVLKSSEGFDLKSSEGFDLFNLKLIVQFVTDALAVHPENYSPGDCLALTIVLLRASLDRKLLTRQLILDVELFLASVVNAIAPEHWEKWVKDLCGHVMDLTTDHHNMVYIVSLIPHVERGIHLKKVLSLVFTLHFLPDANLFEDLLSPKVKHSLNFIEALHIDSETDFYLAWSIFHLLETSIGPDPAERDMHDLSAVIVCIEKKINRIKDSIHKVDQILVKDQMVWLVSKLSILVKTLRKNELFVSTLVPVTVQRLSNSLEESNDEANMDTTESISRQNCGN